MVGVTRDTIAIQGFNYRTTGVTRYELAPDEMSTIVFGNPLVYKGNGREVSGVRAVVTSESIAITTATGHVVTLRREDEPVRRLVASQTLLAGRPVLPTNGGMKASAPDTYLLTDVRVGDRVYIHCRVANGIDTCETICIMRRPGGEVPPAPGERTQRSPKHHERMNARQDWEERGIPIPERFRTILPDAFEYNPVPVAPPPRELPPRIPAAVP